MFVKLQEAYAALSDPIRLKRYQAGLKFQQLAAKSTEEVVFRIPKSCGSVTVKAHNGNDTYYHDPNKLVVDEIVSWVDVYDAEGRVMTSSWNPHATMGKGLTGNVELPFTVTFEHNFDLVVEV